jgi:hypothetical protein
VRQCADRTNKLTLPYNQWPKTLTLLHQKHPDREIRCIESADFRWRDSGSYDLAGSYSILLISRLQLFCRARIPTHGFLDNVIGLIATLY